MPCLSVNKAWLWCVLCIALVLDILGLFILVAWQEVRGALMLFGLAFVLLLSLYRKVMHG